MSVLVEVISVIIRNVTLEEKYPGGVEGYRRDCPNATFYTDGAITRVGFMSREDVQQHIEPLKSLGLVFHRDGQAIDIAVVDMVTGPTTSCEWLRITHHEPGFVAASLIGAPETPLATRPGWDFEHSMSKNAHLSSARDFETRFRFLRHKGALEVYLDITTGKEVFVGRTSGGEDQPAAAGIELGPDLPSVASVQRPEPPSYGIVWRPLPPEDELARNMGCTEKVSLPYLSEEFAQEAESPRGWRLDTRRLVFGVLICPEGPEFGYPLPSDSQLVRLLYFATKDLPPARNADELSANAAGYLRGRYGQETAVAALRRAVQIIPNAIFSRAALIKSLWQTAESRPEGRQEALEELAVLFDGIDAESIPACTDEEDVLYAGMAALRFLGREAELHKAVEVFGSRIARSRWLRERVPVIRGLAAGEFPMPSSGSEPGEVREAC